MLHLRVQNYKIHKEKSVYTTKICCEISCKGENQCQSMIFALVKYDLSGLSSYLNLTP